MDGLLRTEYIRLLARAHSTLKASRNRRFTKNGLGYGVNTAGSEPLITFSSS